MIEKPRVQRVRPVDITTDYRVQRRLDLRRVEGMVDAWQEESVGVPAVSRRADGTMIWIDGQHRGAALVKLGRGTSGVLAQVYEGLSLAEEAQLFRQLNNSKNLTAADIYRIAVTEGDPVAVASNNALTTYGWTMQPSCKNSLRALSTLALLWEQDEAVARATLRTLAQSWGPTPVSGSAVALRGLFAVGYRYRDLKPPIDWDRMTLTLSKQGQAAQFLARARGNAAGRGIAVVDGFADLTINAYNKTKRTLPLPMWDTAAAR
jgi:hypothetical protein